MGATSVTGVRSQHQTLGVNHLIGPRWDKDKERKFNTMLWVVTILCVLQTISFTLIWFLLAR